MSTASANDAAAPTCEQSLQSLVDAAPAGATVNVPACIHREQLTIGKSLTLIGQPGAEIRGSDVWTAWSASADRWQSAQSVPVFPAHGECMPGENRCLLPEQVFRDGTRLLQNPAGEPTSGHFALDGNRHVLLGDDPAGHTIEVTTRTIWIDAQADGVTLQGLTMKHAASDAQVGALGVNSRSNWTIQDSVLSDAHGVVVSLGTGANNRLLRNDIARGGQLGVAGGNGSGNLIQSNKIHGNNTDGFTPEWEAGGLKAALTTNSTWDDNDAYNNIGPGLWCDINCKNMTISNNRTHDNMKAAGILFEVSDGAKIFGNSAWNNGSGAGWGWGGGIVISSSANTELHDNFVAFNQSGISVVSQNRSDQPSIGSVNNYVHNNTIIMGEAPGDSLALSWLQDWNGQIFAQSSNNRGSANSYWYPGPENGRTRFGWNGPLAQLRELSDTPGGTGAYLTDSQQQDVLTEHGLTTAGVSSGV